MTSDKQTNVKAVEWRPNSGKMIAVACNCVLLLPDTVALAGICYFLIEVIIFFLGEGYASS